MISAGPCSEVLQLQAAAAVHAPRGSDHGRNVMLPPPAVRWSMTGPPPVATTAPAAPDGSDEEEMEAIDESNFRDGDPAECAAAGYTDAEREAVQAAPAG